MAARIAARYISRRLSSSGKGLSEVKVAGKLYKKVLNDLQKMEQDKLGGKGPPKPSGETPAADPDPHWLTPYVLGSAALVALGASVVWNVDMYIASEIVFAGFYADHVLRSKYKIQTAARAVCFMTLSHAINNSLRDWDLDSKRKTKKVEE